MHSSNRLSCMFHCTCLQRAVQCSIHSGNNNLFLSVILCVSLILQIVVTAGSCMLSAEAGDSGQRQALRLLCCRQS